MESQLFRVSEALKIAGVGRSFGYQLIQSGQWPSVKLGRSIRIPRIGLQKWLDEQNAKAEERAARLREGAAA